MTWQILKQLCNSLGESTKLILLRESTEKGNEISFIKYHAMSLNKRSPYTKERVEKEKVHGFTIIYIVSFELAIGFSWWIPSNFQLSGSVT